MNTDDEKEFDMYETASCRLNDYLIDRDSYMESYLDDVQRDTMKYILYTFDTCNRMKKELIVGIISDAIAKLPGDEVQNFLDLLAWLSDPENYQLVDWIFGGHVNQEFVYHFFSEAYTRDGYGLVIDVKNPDPSKRIVVDKTEVPLYPSDVLDILIELSDNINFGGQTVH